MSTAVAAGKNSVRANAETTGITVTRTASLQNGDVLYCFLLSGDNANAITTWAGSSGGTWTQVHFRNDTDGSDRTTGIMRRVVTDAGSEPASYTFAETGNNGNDNMVAILVRVRGADTTTPEDAAVTSAVGLNDFTPDGVAITTVTDNALALTAHAASGPNAENFNNKTAGPPSGYTLVDSELFDDLVNSNNIFLEVAKLEDAGAAGAEDPGVWTGTPNDATSEFTVFTLAVRPAATSEAVYGAAVHRRGSPYARRSF